MLVIARRDEVSVDPAEIQRMGDDELIELIKYLTG